MKSQNNNGGVLKNLIRESGRTQREIADLIYVSEGTMSNYVNDKTRLTPEMCIKLSEIFGVSVDYLLGREKSGFDVFRLDPDERLIIECYRTSSPPNKKRIFMQITSGGDNICK